MDSQSRLERVLTEYREKLCVIPGDEMDSGVFFRSLTFTTGEDYGANDFLFFMNVRREGVFV